MSASEKVVDELVRAISQIATLPEVAMKVVDAVEDPASSSHDLVKLIHNDPALGTRILKIVNSAFYGLPRQIGSVERAVTILGMNAVKDITLAASLVRMFRHGQISETLDAHDLWSHCIAVATAARMLQVAAKADQSEEAFLAGLVHDLGILVEVQVRRQQFVKALEMVDSGEAASLLEAERKVLGADHQQVGAALCRHWSLPEVITQVVEHHHDPQAADAAHQQMVAMVHIGEQLVEQVGSGFNCLRNGHDVHWQLAKQVGLDEAKIASVVEQLPAAIEEAANLLYDSQ